MRKLHARGRQRIVRALTLLLACVLLTRPETAHLGVLLDGVGLDTFLLLLEVQLLVGLGIAYRHALLPVWLTMQRLLLEPLAAWLGDRLGLGLNGTAGRGLDGYLLRNCGPFGLWVYLDSWVTLAGGFSRRAG